MDSFLSLARCRQNYVKDNAGALFTVPGVVSVRDGRALLLLLFLGENTLPSLVLYSTPDPRWYELRQLWEKMSLFDIRLCALLARNLKLLFSSYTTSYPPAGCSSSVVSDYACTLGSRLVCDCVFFAQAMVSLLFSFMVIWDLPNLTRGMKALKTSRLAFAYNTISPQVHCSSCQ